MKARSSVGKRVIAARAAQKPPMSQVQLLKRLRSAGIDIDLARLAEIENGTRGPHQLEMITLAGVLNTSVRCLSTGDGA